MNSSKTWQSRDGKVHNICDMTTSHIQNCLKMLRRNGFISFQDIISGPIPNGDMAQYFYEQDLEEAFGYVHLAIDILEEELRTRNVTN